MNRREELERIGRERLAAEHEMRKVELLRMARTCAELIVSCLAGVVIMGFAFRVTDKALGEILLLSGMVVGYTGMALSLAAAFRRSKGDE
jgi:hypothetical protein